MNLADPLVLAAGAGGTQERTPFDGILERSRDLISQRLDAAIAGMLDKSGESLAAAIDAARNREERDVLEKTREATRSGRETMETDFHARYLREFRQRGDRARKIGASFAEADFSLDSLEIVSDDDLQETLKFNDIAAKLRVFCDDELMALDQRVGVLLGDANLQVNDNPFSPQVICDAYKHACRQLSEDLAVRRLLLKLFDDHVLDEIRSVYKAVNALLVQNSILPQIRHGAPGKDGRKTRAHDAEGAQKDAGNAAQGEPAAAAQDVFSILQKLVAANLGAAAQPGVAGAGQPSGGALQGAELLGSLTRIQLGDVSGVAGGGFVASPGDAGTANVLHGLKDTSVGAGMGQMDLMTLDIVALLFDQLFDDEKVPDGVKGLIGRMQIPMLKVAIADKTFFSTKTHPARRLLDTLGEIAARLPADFGSSNPMFPRLEGILQGLLENFQENVEIFDAARAQMEALVAEEDRRVERENEAVAQRIAEMETLALAKSEAQEELKARLQSHSLPGPVLEFLVEQWLKLLLVIHVKQGKASDAWNDALQTMDQLIWSVEPKTTVEARRKLAGVIPGLIKKLVAGLNAAGIADDVRTQFFAELMKYHTQAIAHASAAPAHPEKQAPGSAPKSGAPAPRPPEFSPTITVKNPFGDGEVKVDSLDFSAASAPRAGRDAAIEDLVANLARGTWVRFGETGDAGAGRTVRLILVSPRATRYLFALDKAGKEIIQCTRAELTRRFRLREAVVAEEPPEEPLFDRIMGGVVGTLRARGAH